MPGNKDFRASQKETNSAGLWDGTRKKMTKIEQATRRESNSDEKGKEELPGPPSIHQYKGKSPPDSRRNLQGKGPKKENKPSCRWKVNSDTPKHPARRRKQRLGLS